MKHLRTAAFAIQLPAITLIYLGIGPPVGWHCPTGKRAWRWHPSKTSAGGTLGTSSAPKNHPWVGGPCVKNFGKDSTLPEEKIKWEMTRLYQNAYTWMLTAKGPSRTDRVGEIRRIGTAPTTTRQRTQQGNNRQQHKPDKNTTTGDNKREKTKNLCVLQFPLFRRESLFFVVFSRDCVRERGRFSLL